MIGLDGWKQREQEMENNEMVTQMESVQSKFIKFESVSSFD